MAHKSFLRSVSVALLVSFGSSQIGYAADVRQMLLDAKLSFQEEDTRRGDGLSGDTLQTSSSPEQMEIERQEALQELQAMNFSLTTKNGDILKYVGDTLSEVKRPDGALLKNIQLDAEGNIAAADLKLADGSIQIYQNGRVIGYETPDGSQVIYENGDIQKVISKDGVETLYTYLRDAQGAVIQTTLESPTHRTIYDASGKLKEVLRKSDGRLSFYASGMLEKIRYADTSEFSFLTESVEANFRVTLSSVKDAQGRLFHYSGTDVVKMTDSDGAIWENLAWAVDGSLSDAVLTVLDGSKYTYQNKKLIRSVTQAGSATDYSYTPDRIFSVSQGMTNEYLLDKTHIKTNFSDGSYTLYLASGPYKGLKEKDVTSAGVMFVYEYATVNGVVTAQKREVLSSIYNTTTIQAAASLSYTSNPVLKFNAFFADDGSIDRYAQAQATASGKTLKVVLNVGTGSSWTFAGVTKTLGVTVQKGILYNVEIAWLSDKVGIFVYEASKSKPSTPTAFTTDRAWNPLFNVTGRSVAANLISGSSGSYTRTTAVADKNAAYQPLSPVEAIDFRFNSASSTNKISFTANQAKVGNITRTLTFSYQSGAWALKRSDADSSTGTTKNVSSTVSQTLDSAKDYVAELRIENQKANLYVYQKGSARPTTATAFLDAFSASTKLSASLTNAVSTGKILKNLSTPAVSGLGVTPLSSRFTALENGAPTKPAAATLEDAAPFSELLYDASSQLKEIKQTDGSRLVFENNLLKNAYDAAGNATVFSFEESVLSNLVGSTITQNNLVSTYDAKGRLSSVKIGDMTVRYAEGQDTVESIEKTDGTVLRNLVFDASGNVIGAEITSPGGEIRTYIAGKLTHLRQADETEIEYADEKPFALITPDDLRYNFSYVAGAIVATLEGAASDALTPVKMEYDENYSLKKVHRQNLEILNYLGDELFKIDFPDKAPQVLTYSKDPEGKILDYKVTQGNVETFYDPNNQPLRTLIAATAENPHMLDVLYQYGKIREVKKDGTAVFKYTYTFDAAGVEFTHIEDLEENAVKDYTDGRLMTSFDRNTSVFSTYSYAGEEVSRVIVTRLGKPLHTYDYSYGNGQTFVTDEMDTRRTYSFEKKLVALEKNGEKFSYSYKKAMVPTGAALDNILPVGLYNTTARSLKPDGSASWFSWEKEWGKDYLVTYWPNEWVEYSADLTQIGDLQIDLEAVNDNAGGLPTGYTDFDLEVTLDGVSRGVFKVPAHATAWQAGRITLTGVSQGTHAIRLKWLNQVTSGSAKSNFKFRNFKMTHKTVVLAEEEIVEEEMVEKRLADGSVASYKDGKITSITLAGGEMLSEVAVNEDGSFEKATVTLASGVKRVFDKNLSVLEEIHTDGSHFYFTAGRLAKAVLVSGKELAYTYVNGAGGEIANTLVSLSGANEDPNLIFKYDASGVLLGVQTANGFYDTGVPGNISDALLQRLEIIQAVKNKIDSRMAQILAEKTVLLEDRARQETLKARKMSFSQHFGEFNTPPYEFSPAAGGGVGVLPGNTTGWRYEYSNRWVPQYNTEPHGVWFYTSPSYGASKVFVTMNQLVGYEEVPYDSLYIPPTETFVSAYRGSDKGQTVGTYSYAAESSFNFGESWQKMPKEIFWRTLYERTNPANTPTQQWPALSFGQWEYIKAHLGSIKTGQYDSGWSTITNAMQYMLGQDIKSDNSNTPIYLSNNYGEIGHSTRNNYYFGFVVEENAIAAIDAGRSVLTAEEGRLAEDSQKMNNASAALTGAAPNVLQLLQVLPFSTAPSGLAAAEWRAAARDALLDGQTMIVQEYASDGTLETQTKADGTTTLFENNKPSKVLDSTGIVLIEYSYDAEGHPSRVYLKNARNSLPDEIVKARERIETERAGALRDLAAQKNLAYQSVRDQVEAQRVSINSHLGDLESQYNSVASTKVSGKKAKNQRGDVLNQLGQAMADTRDALTQLAANEADAYAALDSQVKSLSDSIANDSRAALTELANQETKLKKEILTQEVSPVVYDAYRRILGRDPSSAEYESWIAQVDYNSGLQAPQASIYLDGSGDSLSVPDSQDFNLSGGTWTAETWLKTQALGTAQSLFTQMTDTNNYVRASILSNGAIRFTVNRGGVWVVNFDSVSNVITANNWHHVAITQSAGAYKLFVDGVLKVGITDFDAPADYTGSFKIGVSQAGDQYFKGWIDEFRVSRAVARYTANFTPSYEPFETDAQTSFLLGNRSGDPKSFMDKAHTALVLTAAGNTVTDTHNTRFPQEENPVTEVKTFSGQALTSALGAFLAALPELAERQAYVSTIKTRVTTAVNGYLLMTPAQKEAFAASLGLAASDLISLNTVDAEKILSWLNSRSLHFGQSAFLSLESLLDQKGISYAREDIAEKAILIDILTGVITPLDDGDLVLSMFALGKVASGYGLTLDAAKLTYDDLLALFAANPTARVIAHINGNHFVILTAVSTESVTYIDPGIGKDKQNESVTITKQKFSDVWQGHVLAEKVHTQALAGIQTKLLSVEQAQKIRGAFFPLLFAAIFGAISSIGSAIGAVIAGIGTFLTNVGVLVGNVLAGIGQAMGGFLQNLGYIGKALFSGIKFAASSLFKVFSEVGTVISQNLFGGLTKTAFGQVLFKNIAAIGLNLGLSRGLENLGINPTITNLISSFTIGGVLSGFSNQVFNLGTFIGEGIKSSLLSAGQTILGKLGLDAPLSSLVSVLASPLINGMRIGDIAGQMVKLVQQIPQHLSFYGIQKLGDSLGMNPLLTGLIGGPISSAFAATIATTRWAGHIQDAESYISIDRTGYTDGSNLFHFIPGTQEQSWWDSVANFYSSNLNNMIQASLSAYYASRSERGVMIPSITSVSPLPEGAIPVTYQDVLTGEMKEGYRINTSETSYIIHDRLTGYAVKRVSRGMVEEGVFEYRMVKKTDGSFGIDLNNPQRLAEGRIQYVSEQGGEAIFNIHEKKVNEIRLEVESPDIRLEPNTTLDLTNKIINGVVYILGIGLTLLITNGEVTKSTGEELSSAELTRKLKISFIFGNGFENATLPEESADRLIPPFMNHLQSDGTISLLQALYIKVFETTELFGNAADWTSDIMLRLQDREFFKKILQGEFSIFLPEPLRSWVNEGVQNDLISEIRTALNDYEQSGGKIEEAICFSHSGFFAPFLNAIQKAKPDGSYYDIHTLINYEGPYLEWNENIQNPNLKRVINVWGTGTLLEGDFGPPFLGVADFSGVENINIEIKGAFHNDFSYDETNQINDPERDLINKKTNEFMRRLYQVALEENQTPGQIELFLRNTPGISLSIERGVWEVDPLEASFI